MHVSRIRAGFVVVLVFCVWQPVNAAPPKDLGDAPTDRKAPKPSPGPPVRPLRDLDKVLAEPIKPSPEVPIPDDPPPHEGAMFELPYVIEAPDLVIVEVLEGLPGRPITGEHLVRPDGTITLGFYGDVHVQGLTLPQAKVRIIQRLRRFLSDDALGLLRIEGPTDDDDAANGAMAPQDRFELLPPKEAAPPAGRKADAATRSQSRARVHTLVQWHRRPAPRAAPPPRRAVAGPTNPIRLAQARTAVDDKATAPETMLQPAQTAEGVAGAAQIVLVPPNDSDTIYLDIESYNSKFYFVQGDTAAPGRFPWTGRETVLDAINNSGGFMPTADARNIRLVRPARGGKQAHVYPIDLQAIVEKGDKTGNLQIFPGDRLVVGRGPVVKTTVAVDRAAASIQSALTSIRLASAVERALFPPPTRTVARLQVGGLTWILEAAGEEKAVTPAQREETVKAWVEFWSKMAARAGGADGDDALLREALLRHLKPVAPVLPGSRK